MFLDGFNITLSGSSIKWKKKMIIKTIDMYYDWALNKLIIDLRYDFVILPRTWYSADIWLCAVGFWIAKRMKLWWNDVGAAKYYAGLFEFSTIGRRNELKLQDRTFLIKKIPVNKHWTPLISICCNQSDKSWELNSRT